MVKYEQIASGFRVCIFLSIVGDSCLHHIGIAYEFKLYPLPYRFFLHFNAISLLFSSTLRDSTEFIGFQLNNCIILTSEWHFFILLIKLGIYICCKPSECFVRLYDGYVLEQPTALTTLANWNKLKNFVVIYLILFPCFSILPCLIHTNCTYATLGPPDNKMALQNWKLHTQKKWCSKTILLYSDHTTPYTVFGHCNIHTNIPLKKQKHPTSTVFSFWIKQNKLWDCFKPTIITDVCHKLNQESLETKTCSDLR